MAALMDGEWIWRWQIGLPGSSLAVPQISQRVVPAASINVHAPHAQPSDDDAKCCNEAAMEASSDDDAKCCKEAAIAASSAIRLAAGSSWHKAAIAWSGARAEAPSELQNLEPHG